MLCFYKEGKYMKILAISGNNSNSAAGNISFTGNNVERLSKLQAELKKMSEIKGGYDGIVRTKAAEEEAKKLTKGFIPEIHPTSYERIAKYYGKRVSKVRLKISIETFFERIKSILGKAIGTN